MRSSRVRSSLIFWILALGFFLVIARSIQFQLKPNQKLIKLSQTKRQLDKQQQNEDLITSRGAIVDRNDRDLALSVVVKSFFANPKVIKNPLQTAQRLSPYLGISTPKLLQQLKQDRYFVWLKREVDQSTSEKIEALQLDGIFSKKESKRIYPHGELARSVIGVAGTDGQGLEGIEKQYDEYLKTSDKASGVGLRDALGRLLRFDDFEREWFETHHVVSTLDLRIQRVVEDELRSTLQEKDARSAQAILMNPKTGEVLAMASLDGRRGDQNPLRNRPVTDVYEPGSTFKIILASAGVQEFKMTPNSQIYGENGSLRVGSHTIKEFHNHRYGWLTLQELLEVSSNVASAKLGLKLGARSFSSMVKNLGFGQLTGIDLPGEAQGLVRDGSSWKPIELANISFGQGIGVTPLQMVSAVAAVANGGIMVKPYIVSKVMAPKSSQSEALPVYRAQEERREVLSAETSRTLTDMLIHVTDKGSTGVEAAIDGYHVAGKTGTSQKLVEKVSPRGKVTKTYSLEKSVVSFIGYVPAYDPAFVLLVLYDEPVGRSSGGNTAAPSFRRIASRALAILGVAPQRGPTSIPVAAAEVKDHVAKSSTPNPQVSDAETVKFVGKSFQEVLSMVRELPQDRRAKIDLIGFGTAFKEETAEDRTKVYFR